MTASTEKRIAKIENTHLGEDHGVLTAYLFVDYGEGGKQGIGGYSLDRYNRETEQRVGTAYGCEFIRRLMLACGVSTWEKLSGRTVYAICNRAEPAGFGHKVIGIEPLPTEPGEPFIFSELAAEFSEEGES